MTTFNSNNSNNTRNTRIFLLILVGVLLIAVTLVAGKLLIDSQSVGENINNSVNVSTKSKEMPEVSKETFTHSIGFISEMKENPEGKWIILDVALFEAKLEQIPVSGADQSPAKAPLKPLKIAKHKFFLSLKDTEGAKDINGGDFVDVSFLGEPSENDHMLAKKVEKIGS